MLIPKAQTQSMPIHDTLNLVYQVSTGLTLILLSYCVWKDNEQIQHALAENSFLVKRIRELEKAKN